MVGKALAETSSSERKKLTVLVSGLLFAWTMFVIIAAWIRIEDIDEQYRKYAYLQAETAFMKDLEHHSRNVFMNGSFVLTSNLPAPEPNQPPHPRDGKTSSGASLTRLTPALIAAFTQKDALVDTSLKGRFTSPLATSIQNRPDAWEAHSLQVLGTEEVTEVSKRFSVDGKEFLRVIRPVRTVETCLKCHAAQGFTLGAIDGGVSYFVPMETMLASSAKRMRQTVASHVGVWALIVGLLLFASHHRNLRLLERNRALADMQALMEELEERVAERTRTVEVREQQLLAFMDNSEIGMYQKDIQGKYVLANSSFAEMAGSTPQHILGKRDEELFGGGPHAELLSCEELALMQGASLCSEGNFDLRRPDAAFTVHIFPVLDGKKKTVGVGGIIIDVTESKRALEAKNAAEAASRAKSEFLANISHEIRTPLNGVIGMADILLHSQLSLDQASMVATIKNGGDSLLAVLNDILDFSKIEAGKVILDPQPFCLRDIVFDTVKGLAPIAYKKHLEILVQVDNKVPEHVIGDSTRIRQILVNLVSNAIKFTQEGEVQLKVTLRALAGAYATMRVSVSDTGIGIPFEKQLHIFEAFEQADTSTTRKFGGTGLGLAIAFRLARLMGSHLVLTSRPGEGSLFSFDLELPYLPLMETVRTDFDRQHALEGKHVLLLDDNEMNRRILCEELVAWKMVPYACSTTEEALVYLRHMAGINEHVAIVLTDLQIPGTDGIEFLSLLRDEPAYEHTPAILLSSGNLPPNSPYPPLYQAQLAKPVRPCDLLRVLMEVLSGERCYSADDLKPVSEQSPSGVTEGRHLRILLVEDMEMNQVVASRMLRNLGHHVTVVENGMLAVQAVAEGGYDLVFMDIQMPVMDGTEAARLIREGEGSGVFPGRIPIIAMTAHALKGDKEKYLENYMDAYISKPLYLNALEAVIESVSVQFSLPHRVCQEDGAGKGADIPAQPSASAEAGALGAGTASGQGGASAPGLRGGIDRGLMYRSIGDDPHVLRQAMEIYLGDAPLLFREMVKAAEQGDTTRLVNSAHALKGVTAYYTQGEVYEKLKHIEDTCRRRGTLEGRPGLEEDLHSLHKDLEMLLLSIRGYLDE